MKLNNKKAVSDGHRFCHLSVYLVKEVLEAVIDEKVPNEKEKLTEFINKKTM